jgi:hypothetical protein
MPTAWFEVVTGRTLEQGDIISDCPIYSPIFPSSPDQPVTEVDEFSYDTIVMSQSCDLVIDREKLSHVVLCPLRNQSEIANDSSHPLANKGALKNAAKHKEPAFFVLAGFDHERLRREIAVVHFRQVFTLPVGFLRTIAEKRGERLRLCSPYKEALASRFAAFFGRVALPIDVVV